MGFLIPVLAAFFVGAIPFAVLIGRVAGVDVRQHGSGNPGATNVWRIAGRFTGVAVLALDALKGWVAVVGLRAYVTDEQPWLLVAAGGAAILGHVFSPFLMFRGGKGVATSAGVVGALAPRLLVAPLAFFVIVLVLRRRVSEASLVAAIVLPLAAGLYRLLPPQGWPERELLVICSAVTLLLFWTHRANVRRLRSREESELTP